MHQPLLKAQDPSPFTLGLRFIFPFENTKQIKSHHKEIAYKMFCKCITVGNKRLSENNQNCLLHSVFFFCPFYISFTVSVDLCRLCQPSAKGGCWERMGAGGGDRRWHRLLPGSACLAAPSGQGARGTGRKPPSRFQTLHVLFHSMRKMPCLCCRQP